MRRLVVLGFFLVSLCTSVAAADLGGQGPGSLKDEPFYAPPFSWTGVYIGAQLGYGWGDTDARSGPLGTFNQNYSYDYSGFVGGSHVGYNFQSGNVVYGVEADFELADLSDTALGSAGSAHNTDVNWMGSLRGRFGFTSGRALYYVTGGWAFGSFDISSVSGALATNDTRNGWTLGAGYEYAFANNLSARLEYRYTDFGNDGFSNATLQDESDITVQAIRAGISVRF